MAQSRTFMYTYIIVLLGCIFFMPSAYAAGNSCAIKDGMSEELATYMQTADILLSKIGEEALKKQCNANVNGENSASASVDKTTSAIVGSMNESIGFSNFYTSGRFYIDIALKTEIPLGITRDHEQLGRQTERINNMIDLVHSHCAEDIIMTSNVSEDPIYKTKDKSLGFILVEMLQNQVDMMNFYRKTVLGDKTEGEYTFILVGNSSEFIPKFQKNYGPSAFEACIKKSDFWKDIKEAFGRITNLGGGIETGMNEWETAMKLLNSNSSDRSYAETERKNLRIEMSAQGMSTKGSDVILNNLAKYDSQNTSEGISGFVSSIGERVYSSVEQFGKTYDDMKALLKKPQTTDQFMTTKKVLDNLKSDINKDIIADYVYAKSLIGPENQNTDETVAKLIDTHIILQTTNTFIQPYIKVSEKTCDAQSTGEGNCQF